MQTHMHAYIYILIPEAEAEALRTETPKTAMIISGSAACSDRKARRCASLAKCKST